MKARLEFSKSLLEEALKHGFVECRTVVCLLFGVAGAGKTHTKHLLFRWAPPECRNSTPLAVRPVQAVRVRTSTQGEQLQEVGPDQLDKILADTVAKGGVPLVKKSFLGKYKIETSKGITPLPLDTIECPPYLLGAVRNPHSTSHSELQELIKSLLDETAYRIATTSQPQQLLDGDWIYLIDCGGQFEFLEVLPAFLQHPSICLFITKLSEMLSECPKIQHYENGMPIGKPTLCPFTNEQMLMRCVQTISTYQDSKLVMVGTHQDLEDQCLESREEKNALLQSKLCPEFDHSLVFYRQGLIFPLNAKNPGPQDYEVASVITKVIFDVVSGLEPRRTPISWFKFEQIIQKVARDYGKRVLQWKECLQVARLLHLSKKDLYAALDHLASFGVIHYYPLLLPDIVFVDPQLLLDKISELVKYHYRLRHTADPKTAAIREKWREFINEGCITLNLLKQFPKHYTDFFTPADFLKLMTNRLIVTQFISIDKYFMPCLLRIMEFEEVDQYRVTASGVAPLAIHFAAKLVPHGVFCSLVAFLLSSQNSSPWRLYLSPNDSTEPLCFTRNCIKFQLPKGAPGLLTLIDTFSHFEVYINAPHDTCVHLCPLIWHTLFEGIQKAAEILKYFLVPKVSFLCKHGYTQPHLALPADAFDYWMCELNPDISGPLRNEHKVWKGNNKICKKILTVCAMRKLTK